MARVAIAGDPIIPLAEPDGRIGLMVIHRYGSFPFPVEIPREILAAFFAKEAKPRTQEIRK